MFKLRFAQAVQKGDISQADAEAFKSFISMNNAPTFNLYIYGKLGQLKHLEGTNEYEAAKRVMEKLGLNNIKFSHKTSQPLEEQFWD